MPRHKGRARHAGGRVVAGLAMAIGAAHAGDAHIVVAPHHQRHMQARAIALERRVNLMAIEAARVLDHGRDLVPGSEAFCRRCSRLAVAGIVAGGPDERHHTHRNEEE